MLLICKEYYLAYGVCTKDCFIPRFWSRLRIKIKNLFHKTCTCLKVKLLTRFSRTSLSMNKAYRIIA